MRSLANYCLDLRFHRPRVEQIKAAIMSMACKEQIQIGPAALNEIIVASNQDMRQVINSVQMWCGGAANDADDQDIESGAAAAHKHLKIGPFEVIRKVFGVESVPLNQSIDLFFQDYSVGPLFVAENYLNVRPVNATRDRKQFSRGIS